MRLVQPGEIDARPGSLAHYLRRVAEEGPERFMPNAAGTGLALVEIGGRPVPLLVVPARPGTSSIVSTLVHYFAYPAESVLGRVLPARAVRRLVALGLWTARITGIDRAVLLDQWLISVGPGLRLPREGWRALVGLAADRWPRHAILARAVTPALDPDELPALIAAGGLPIPRRVIHVFDPKAPRPGQAYRSKRWRISVAIRTAEAARPTCRTDKHLDKADLDALAALYRQQAMGRHSDLNPDYTGEFFDVLAGIEGARLYRWRRADAPDGELRGFCLSLAAGDRICWTVFGADQSRGWEAEFYETVVGELLAQARDLGVPVNLGSTAADYKRNRDARPGWEWDVAFVAHLPWYRRLPWLLLARLRMWMTRAPLPSAIPGSSCTDRAAEPPA